MAAAQFEALEASEVDVVRRWRFDELVRVGYGEEDALELAFHLDVDLHVATNLVRRGCPSSTVSGSRCTHGRSIGSARRSRRESWTGRGGSLARGLG